MLQTVMNCIQPDNGQVMCIHGEICPVLLFTVLNTRAKPCFIRFLIKIPKTTKQLHLFKRKIESAVLSNKVELCRCMQKL